MSETAAPTADLDVPASTPTLEERVEAIEKKLETFGCVIKEMAESANSNTVSLTGQVAQLAGHANAMRDDITGLTASVRAGLNPGDESNSLARIGALEREVKMLSPGFNSGIAGMIGRS